MAPRNSGHVYTVVGGGGRRACSEGPGLSYEQEGAGQEAKKREENSIEWDGKYENIHSTGGPWLVGPNIVVKNGKIYRFLCIP